MKRLRLDHGSRLAVFGVLLLGFGGCLGPNPGFFISTSAANATISVLVNGFLNDLLALARG